MNLLSLLNPFFSKVGISWKVSFFRIVPDKNSETEVKDSITRPDQIAYDFTFPQSRTLLATRYVCFSDDGRDHCLWRRLTVADSGGRLIDMQKLQDTQTSRKISGEN